MKTKILGLLAVTLMAGPMSAQAVLVGTLDQVSPTSTSYVNGVQTGVFAYSGVGDVTAPVIAVDLQLGLGNTSTSGCEAADFVGFAVGSIALLQRGGCLFREMAENAAAAGAVGVLIFNQGNDPLRTGLIIGTLSDLYAGGIPVMGLTYDLGVEFANTSGLIMRMVVSDVPTVPEPGTLALILAGLAGLGLSRRRTAA